MANTTDYRALYEAIGVKLMKHISSNDYNILNVLRCAGNVSEGYQVERLLDVVLKQDVEADQKIKELEEQMEDMYDEEGVIAERHTFGLVLEDEFDKVKKLQEEQKQFYEKKQKENLDTIVMLTEQVKKLQEENSDKTHWQTTMVNYIEYREKWSDFDWWFGINIDEDDKKHEWVKDWIKNTGYESEEESEGELTESEAEEDKYDGDDWAWVYGKMIVKNDDGFDDVVLCIAGGGDHWENWIMRPSMNYIENKDGLHPQRGQVLVQSSCGNYVSFQDEDYVCEGDECMCEYEHCVGS